MKSIMNKISPLDSCRKERFRQSAHRIMSAHRGLFQSFNEQPIKRDVFPESEAIAAWGIVSCSYSGIEQAMKCLLQMRDAYIGRGDICKECLKRELSGGTDACSSGNNCRYNGHYKAFFQAQPDFIHSLRSGNHKHHQIGKLFRALASEEQEVLRVSYRIYRSLHDYIPLETVDCFLDAIDTGYPSWRYFLLEGEMPPTTHPGAMLEIWSALSGILGAKVFTNHGLYSAERRIRHSLHEALNNAWTNQFSTDFGKREIDDLNHWILRDHKNLSINAYTDLFFHAAESSVDSVKVLSSTRELLYTIVGIVDEKWVDNDFDHFLRRARMGDIVWCPETQLFEKASQRKPIEIKVIETDDSYVEDFQLDPSVKADIIETVPGCIEDFIFEPRHASHIVDDEWSAEDEFRKAREEHERRMGEMYEYEGANECEGYRCYISGMNLIMILFDSKEWIVYRYNNNDVPGVPHYCKHVAGKLRSIREAIRAIEHWRRTDKKGLEALRNAMWNRRGRKRSRARRDGESLSQVGRNGNGT